MLDSVVDASALSPQAAGYVPTAYHAGAAALPTAPRFRFQVRPPFGAVSLVLLPASQRAHSAAAAAAVAAHLASLLAPPHPYPAPG